mmetsp:Transcript_32112/g.79365  ORF Transcript_32112/g.79365 Transcript_32112/m.79365 type:complete len:266 (-) Transcript_32112:1285-2082(-)
MVYRKFCRRVQLRMSLSTRRMRKARSALSPPAPAMASSMMEISTTKASNRLKRSLPYSVTPRPATLSTISTMKAMVRNRLAPARPPAYQPGMPSYSMDSTTVLAPISATNSGWNHHASMMPLQMLFSPMLGPLLPSRSSRLICPGDTPLASSSSLSSSSVYSPRAWRLARASSSFCSCSWSSFSSSSTLRSLASVFSSSYTSVITASARLSRKNPPMNTSRMKYTTDQPVTASMHMYMMGVHPSSVMHWKMVSQAYAMLSKLVMP